MTPLFLFLALSGLRLSAALPRPDASQADSSATTNRLAHLRVNAVVHNVDDANNVSQPGSASPSLDVAVVGSAPSPAAAPASSAAPSSEPVVSAAVVSVAPTVVPSPAAPSVVPAPPAASVVVPEQSVQPSSPPPVSSAAPVSVVDTVVPASSAAPAPAPAPAQTTAAPEAPVPAVASVAPAASLAAAAAAASLAPVVPSPAPAPSSSLPAAAPPAAPVAPSSAAPVAPVAPSSVAPVAAVPSSQAPVAAASAAQPVHSTVESSVLVTPEVAPAASSAVAPAPSSAAPVPVPVSAPQSSTTVESSSVVTPEVITASAPPAQPTTPSSSALKSSSSTSVAIPSASSVSPSSSLVRSSSQSTQNAPVTQSPPSIAIQASPAAVNVPTTSLLSSSSSSSRLSSSSSSRLAVSPAVQSPAALSRTVASASSSSSTASRSSSLSSSSSAHLSQSPISSVNRPSSAVDKESSSHASSTSSTKSSSTANASQKALGKSSSTSSSLITPQKAVSTATESAETITKTITSVIDQTHTVTFKTTIVRALPTATLVGTPEHSSQTSTLSSAKIVTSSPAVNAANQTTSATPIIPQSAHRPVVTTTVVTTVVDNVTVTKTMTFTIIGTPVVPVPADTTLFTFGSETTQPADLIPTVVTSKVVKGSETSTMDVTKILTVPRAAAPTISSPPLSFSSIKPPVFSSSVSSASLQTIFDVKTSWTTLVTTLTTSQVQTLTTKVMAPGTTGRINTAVLSAGTSPQPFNTTVIPTPAGSIQPLTTGSAVITGGNIATPTAALSGNIFVPIGTQAPPAQISSRGDHPVPRLGITNQTTPPETNKFYGNLYLGDRTAPAWTHPYSVAWAKGAGVTKSWGIAISQINRTQVVYGPNTPASYYINPGGLQSVIISAAELGNSTAFTMDRLEAFSASIHLSPASGAPAAISFPLVQGMGFVTGVFNRSTPFLQSSIFFTKLTYGGVVSGTSIVRYQILLADNTIWVVYMNPATGSTVPALTLVGNYQIVGNKAFTGTLQVAKNPSDAVGQGIYDSHAGVYPLTGAVQASTNKTQGKYSLTWTKGGLTSRKLLMFALPHHQQSFDPATSSALQKGLTLWTTTKGLATAVSADNFTMVETNLPYDMGFAPWQGPGKGGAINGTKVTLSSNALKIMNNVAANELNEDFDAQTDLDSMYYSGKALAKFAAMIWATNNMAQNKSLASAGLVKLEASFARFVNNQQTYPLVYDTVWGGAVSSATYLTNNSGVDFGNTYYNDHHFHYGYFVYAASVIGFLDPAWLKKGTNKAWVNMLVRDYANPATNDGYFPFSRMFDWFVGHSWAHGLYETFDGKDEESSSEDTFASYAIKMWGRTIGDANMEARGNLMLSIQARSLNSYFLMQSNNTIQPAPFIGNKAAGITFENKVDHTTYFGTNIEYIEGIHMIPINPSSMLTRAQNFITEEWNQYFSNGRVDSIAGGWRGILYSNLALINPKAAWSFFADPAFSNQYLDGGASRTWYLALAAGLGGSS